MLAACHVLIPDGGCAAQEVVAQQVKQILRDVLRWQIAAWLPDKTRL
jgi:hypothetical protein